MLAQQRAEQKPIEKALKAMETPVSETTSPIWKGRLVARGNGALHRSAASKICGKDGCLSPAEVTFFAESDGEMAEGEGEVAAEAESKTEAETDGEGAPVKPVEAKEVA